jgi:hypothetical protein
MDKVIRRRHRDRVPAGGVGAERGDNQPHDVRREVEDLTAVINTVSDRAVSSGTASCLVTAPPGSTAHSTRSPAPVPADFYRRRR